LLAWLVRHLTRNENPVAPLLDPPAGDIVQPWWAEAVAGSQAEAGVVPGTAHAVADQESFREGTTVVAANGPDGIPLSGLPGQKHGLASDMPGEHCTIRDLIHG
jgi:hypothetical protein